jgi:hypothetical protein
MNVHIHVTADGSAIRLSSKLSHYVDKDELKALKDRTAKNSKKTTLRTHRTGK